MGKARGCGGARSEGLIRAIKSPKSEIRIARIDGKKPVSDWKKSGLELEKEMAERKFGVESLGPLDDAK